MDLDDEAVMARELLSIDIGAGFADDVDRLNLRLGVFADQIQDMRPVNEVQFAALEGFVTQQFQTEGRHGGTPWATYKDAGDIRHERIKHSILAHAKTGRWPRHYNARGEERRIPRMALLRWVLGGPRTPIQRGERLLPSFYRGHPDNIRVSRPDGFSWGSRYAVAEKHQKGTGPRRWDPGTTPKRAILTNSKKLRAPLVRNIQEYVLKQAEAIDPAGGAGGVGDKIARPASAAGLQQLLEGSFGL